MMSLIFSFLVLTAIVTAGVLFFLKKILREDTESAINRLNRVYQDLLKRQEELTEKIQTTEKEYTQKKEELELLKGKMISDATEEARQKRDEIMKTAKEEADELVAKAHASTQKYMEELEKKMSQKTIDFAADIVAALWTEQIGTLIHQEMVKEFVERAQEFDLSHIGTHVDQVTIKAPYALSKEDREKIEQILLKKLGRSIKIVEENDQALIAGVVLQFGTLLLDGSLRNSIKEAALRSKKKIETG